ncbi:unannotated protein [freshwater metagenome]|uniref:Unannotated protein n=1 Tax=freshwater metagenome TaxID=449393 RepID=A0A6J7JUM3_9ZZZZ
MNARVRRPGSSAFVTASATALRVARSGLVSCESATSSGTVRASPSPGRSTSMTDVSSSNRRSHAPRLEEDFSARMRSSGSESRCGFSLRTTCRWWRAFSTPGDARSSAARSSSRAVHSSSKNRSFVWIAVPRSSTAARSAPCSGFAVSSANFSDA